MKLEDFLDDIEQKLFDIHDILFGEELTIDDLSEIKEILNEYLEGLKEFEACNNEVNKKVARLIKLIQIFFHISSLLTICFIILNVLSLAIGIGIIIFLNYIAYGLKRSYQQSKANDKITSELAKLIEDVKYKQNITNKKMRNFKRISELQIESSKKIDIQPTNNIELKEGRARVLKLKNRQ